MRDLGGKDDASFDGRETNCGSDLQCTNTSWKKDGTKDELEMLLEAFAQIDSSLLDLSHYQLKSVPSPLMSLSRIEYLYLSNNHLQSLPETFFPSLPSLKWFDVRYNFLRTVPKNISTARLVFESIQRCKKFGLILFKGGYCS